MSSPTSTSTLSPLFKRLAVGMTLLLMEYLLVSYRFDAANVRQRTGSWIYLSYLGRLGPLLIMCSSAMLLLGWKSIRTILAEADCGAPRVPFLLLHVLSFGGLYYVTAKMFGSPSAPSGPFVLWLLLWLSGFLLTLSGLFAGLVRQTRRAGGLLLRPMLLGFTLGALAWLGGNLAGQMWGYLAGPTFGLVRFLLSCFSIHPEVDPKIHLIELDGFAIQVAPVCSGFEGIGLYLVLMSLYLYQQRAVFKFPRALLLLPTGVLAIWVGNAARISALLVLGAHYDPEVAVGSFHSKAGWVFFSGITIVIAIIAARTSWLVYSPSPGQDRQLGPTRVSGSPKLGRTKEADQELAPLLLPLLIWISVGLLSSSLSQGHDPFYGLRVAVTFAVLFRYRASYLYLWRLPSLFSLLVGSLVGVAWLLVPSLFGQAKFEPSSHQDLSLSYVGWLATRTIGAVLIIPLVEELAFRSFLARWIGRREFSEVPFSQLSWVGILASSTIFALVHEQHVLALATGLLYALLLRHKGQLIEPIFAHAVSNLIIALWVLFTGDFRHW